MELWRTIETGECVAWVGSGLSIGAGYPSWPIALDTLCDDCGVERLPGGFPSSDDWAHAALIKAQECKQANPVGYGLTLGRLYGTTDDRTRRAYDLIAKLPFKAYLTTNFDPLMADAAARNGKAEFHAYPDLKLGAVYEKPGQVFYIHGMAVDENGHPAGDNLVFSEREFDLAYSSESLLPGLLCQVITYHPLVFFACALSEFEIRQVFMRVSSILTSAEAKQKRRVMLMPLPAQAESSIGPVHGIEEVADRTGLRRIEELGIIPIMYKPADPIRQYEVEQILDKACELAGVQIRPLRVDSFERGIGK